VKRKAILISIVLGLLFIAAQIFAATLAEDQRRPTRNRRPTRSGYRSRRPRFDVNSLLPKPKFLADSNSIKSELKKFQGLSNSVQKLNTASRNLNREWLTEPAEEKMKLAAKVQQQVVAELSLLRELASQEGAKKTVAAIDAVLYDRQQRYGKILLAMDRAIEKGQPGDRRYRRDNYRSGNPRNPYYEDDGSGDSYRRR